MASPLFVRGLLPLVLLFAALYGAYGTESPFFPAFLVGRGLSPTSLGIVLAAGTIMRLIVGPFVGAAADRIGVVRALAATLLGSGLVIFLYLLGTGFWPLLVVCLLHSTTTAPLTALADTVALRASERRGAFPYGWVRGMGSAGFIAGTLASGLLAQRFGLDAIIVAAGLLFMLAAIPVAVVPAAARTNAIIVPRAVAILAAMPAFRAVVAVSALVIGSHAVLDGFAIIHWRHAGLGDATISLLWSVAVASEIAVFVFAGPLLLARYGPARCALFGAIAGIARWTVLALTTEIFVVAGSQLLHGLAFSLVHLACMQVIARRVPDAIAATAQTIYGTLSVGLASALLTILSGALFEAVGAAAFWPMAAICALAIPLTSMLPGLDDRQAVAAS